VRKVRTTKVYLSARYAGKPKLTRWGWERRDVHVYEMLSGLEGVIAVDVVHYVEER
jgi:hypothetical protein